MKNTELRIGNYMELKKPFNKELSKYFKVNYIADDMPIRYMKPIPLTENILLKCGFIKMKYSSLLSIYKNDKIEILEDLSVIFVGNKKIKLLYVHQFQNIYFYLTNEELNINL